MSCVSCGDRKAYVGLLTIECPNRYCRHFNPSLNVESVKKWQPLYGQLFIMNDTTSSLYRVCKIQNEFSFHYFDCIDQGILPIGVVYLDRVKDCRVEPFFIQKGDEISVASNPNLYLWDVIFKTTLNSWALQMRSITGCEVEFTYSTLELLMSDVDLINKGPLHNF